MKRLGWFLAATMLTMAAYGQTGEPATTDLTTLPTSELMTLAEQNLPQAQLELAQRCALGIDTEQDDVQAYKWTILAERGGADVTVLRALLKGRMTTEQIEKAQALADIFTGSLPKSFTYQSDTEHFKAQFPAEPKRVVMQDNNRLYAVHYQALSADGLVQYNVSVQTLKDRKLASQKAKQQFFNDYLTTRSLFAWKNQLQKKMLQWQGLPAAQFKHKTFSAAGEMTHEGLVALTDQQAYIITCVYPTNATLPIPVQDYFASFELTAAAGN